MARKWGMFLIALLISQVVFWFVISPLLGQRTSIPPEMLISDFQIAQVEDTTLNAIDALPSDAWSSAKAGWYASSEKPTHVIKLSIPLTEDPTNDFGLLAGIGADNYHVWVNGFPILDEGRIGTKSSQHARALRGVLRVPQATLQSGTNEILIVMTRATPGYTDIFRHAFGDYATLQSATAKRSFMLHKYRPALMIVFGLIGVFAWICLLFSTKKSFLFWFAVLTSGLALQIAERYLGNPPWSPEWVVVGYFTLSVIVATAWFNLLDTWTGRGWPRVRLLVSGLGVAIIAFVAIDILRSGVAGYDRAGYLIDTWSLIAGLSAGAILIARIPGQGASRPWEAAALLVGVSALITDAGFQFLASRKMNFIIDAMPFLLLALTAALIARNIRIYDSMGTLNAELNEKLRQREAEMDERYRELRAAQRARDLAEERQRILRDMHDGIGSQLTGLIVQAKSGEMPLADMRSGLDRALTDLRLVVESLDEASESFSVAMMATRARLTRQLRATEIELDWRVPDEFDIDLSASAVLQISRIIQEAITNTMKHSGASKIKIEAAHDPKRSVLDIRVTDNGSGKRDEAVSLSGKGLNNMRTRARQIGASIEFESDSNGFSVHLVMPLEHSHPIVIGIQDAR